MESMQILMDEHRVIEKVLSCLERIVEKCRARNELDVENARMIFDFLRTFADTCHHCKEEDLLFPLLESRGFSPDEGPTAVMRFEHEQARSLIQAMEQAVSAARDGQAAGHEEFVSNAAEYIGLLRVHIQKEDKCLFPMSENALADQDDQTLLTQFAAAESQNLEPEAKAKYVGFANSLAAEYGITPPLNEP